MDDHKRAADSAGAKRKLSRSRSRERRRRHRSRSFDDREDDGAQGHGRRRDADKRSRRRDRHLEEDSSSRRSDRDSRGARHDDVRRSRRRGSSDRSRSPSRREPPSPRRRSSSRSRSHRNHGSRGVRARSSDRHRSRSPPRRSRKPLPSQNDSYRDAGGRDEGAVEKPPPKEKPNYKPTGLLAAESNKVTVGSDHAKKDIVLKYHEPPEARKPPSSEAWRMFIFKGDSKDPMNTIPLHSRSCWLVGRETAVTDLLLEHPSSSKQHAIFQFRYVHKTDEWGERKGKVGLYLLDLESANGTFLNEKRIDPVRFVECRSGDVIKFGESSREYVLLLPPKE